MSDNSVTDSIRPQQQQEQSSHGEASEHGHTGEGAASALAHMLSQGEKHRRQTAESDEASGSGHP